MSRSTLAGFLRANPHLTKQEMKFLEGMIKGDAQPVARRIAQGVNVNMKIISGYIHDETPLMIASEAASMECIEQLLKAGADVNAVTCSESRGAGDMTALHYATRSLRERPGTKERIVRLLLEAGADPNAKSNGDDTPVSNAASEGALSVLKVLVDAGADPAVGGGLHRAVTRSDIPMVEFLLGAGVAVNAMSSGGVTALMSACRSGVEGMVSYLIERGADARVCTPGGNALTYAAVFARNDCCEEGDYAKALRIVNALIQKGAAINPKDDRGMTPLDYALEANDSRVAEHLKSCGAKRGAEL